MWNQPGAYILPTSLPFRPLPDGVTGLDHFRLRRRDRAGGVIHEYSLVAWVFGTHNFAVPNADYANLPARRAAPNTAVRNRVSLLFLLANRVDLCSMFGNCHITVHILLLEALCS